MHPLLWGKFSTIDLDDFKSAICLVFITAGPVVKVYLWSSLTWFYAAMVFWCFIWLFWIYHLLPECNDKFTNKFKCE